MVFNNMNKIAKIGLYILGGLAVAGIAYALPISVPSAPGRNFILISTSTGAYITTSTSTLGLAGTTTTNVFSKLQTFTSGFVSSASSTIQIGNFGSSTLTGLTLFNGNATGTNLFLSGQFTVGTGTSSAQNGFDITGGCFSVSGTCLQTFIQAATAFKSAANFAATTTLAGSPTYANGSAGVGATLTEVGFGALYVDGNSPAVGNRILVKNQSDQTTNGVYTVTVAGSAIASYVLTRATDFNVSNDIYAGVTVPVLAGTANAGTSWVMTTTGAITVGSSNIVFAESSGANGGVTSIAQIFGSAQTGAITLATSTTAISSDWGITNTNGAFTFNVPNSSASVRGLLTGTDWTTFNAKESALTFNYPLTRSVNAISSAATSTLYANLVSGLLGQSDSGTTYKVATSTIFSNLTSGVLSQSSTGSTYLAATSTDGSFLYATSTMGSGTTTLKISGLKTVTTFTSMGCNSVGGGTFVARLGSSTASSTSVLSSTGLTTTFTALSSNNSFGSGVSFWFEIGSVSGTVANPTCSYTR